jgi:hypothetical protein
LGIASKQAISATLALALAAGLTTFAQSKPGHRALRSVGVVGEPARYTELAFVAPAQLPTRLRRATQTLHVPFTIANHEHAAVSYKWTVSVSGSRTEVASSGVVPVSAGRQATVDPFVRVRCDQRTRVTVRLSSGEHIDFWVTCTP